MLLKTRCRKLGQWAGAALALVAFLPGAGWSDAAEGGATEDARARIQASLDAAEPGERVYIGADEIAGHLRVTQPEVLVWAGDGAEIHGTVHIEAPDVSLVALTVISDDLCVRVGPGAHGLRAYFNRFVASGAAAV